MTVYFDLEAFGTQTGKLRSTPEATEVRVKTDLKLGKAPLSTSLHRPSTKAVKRKQNPGLDRGGTPCNSLPVRLHDESILIQGRYCDEVGLDAPAGPCEPGYYCNGGATTATPDSQSSTGYRGDTCVDRSNGTSNDLCPPGHFCPEGDILFLKGCG